MVIVKCLKCGSFIHQATSCYHCGNQTDFVKVEETQIHENAIEKYILMEDLINEEKFESALSLSYTILEWAPKFAGVFWLRLLAKNRCTTALQLICNGFSIETDSDFYNALKFSSGKEQTVYMDIKKIISEIRKSLKVAINNHEYQCKYKTDVLQIKSKMEKELNARKQKLFSLWSELEKIEQDLYELEMDCRLLMKESQIELENSSNEVKYIKSELDKISECGREAMHRIRIRLNAACEQSKHAKTSIENIKKESQCVESFSQLISKRDEIIRLINSELTSLQSYEVIVKRTLSDIESIEVCHRAALISADRYEFSDTMDLLGKDIFFQVLRESGVNTDSYKENAESKPNFFLTNKMMQDGTFLCPTCNNNIFLDNQAMEDEGTVCSICHKKIVFHFDESGESAKITCCVCGDLFSETEQWLKNGETICPNCGAELYPSSGEPNEEEREIFKKNY